MIPVQQPFIGEKELAAVKKVFESRWLGMGAVTEEFERKLKEFLGAKYVLAVNSGTSALHIALDALDLQETNEVIVPALTFVGSVQAIVAAGARPVFCDVDEETFNIDPDDALSRVTAHTRVIMPVHYGGTVCRMDDLLRIKREKNILVVEDAAHAFGSRYKARQVGTLGDVTCFSFDPIKNITCGEGGAVATDNEQVARKIAVKRLLGIDKDAWSRLTREPSWFYSVVGRGFRYHMSNINAAIGLEQLKQFELFKRRKQLIVGQYDEALGQIAGLKLRKQNLDETFPFLYAVRVLDNRRDDMMAYLKSRGIATGVHYIPNHLHKAFADCRTSLPICERLYREILTLPLYYEMSDGDVAKVIDAVRSFFRQATGRILAVGAKRDDRKRQSEQTSDRSL